MPEWRTPGPLCRKIDQKAENFVEVRYALSGEATDTSVFLDPISSYCPSLFPSNATGMFWAL